MGTMLPAPIILAGDGIKACIMSSIVIGVTSMDNRDVRSVPLMGVTRWSPVFMTYNKLMDRKPLIPAFYLTARCPRQEKAPEGGVSA